MSNYKDGDIKAVVDYLSTGNSPRGRNLDEIIMHFGSRSGKKYSQGQVKDMLILAHKARRIGSYFHRTEGKRVMFASHAVIDEVNRIEHDCVSISIGEEPVNEFKTRNSKEAQKIVQRLIRSSPGEVTSHDLVDAMIEAQWTADPDTAMDGAQAAYRALKKLGEVYTTGKQKTLRYFPGPAPEPEPIDFPDDEDLRPEPAPEGGWVQIAPSGYSVSVMVTHQNVRAVRATLENGAVLTYQLAGSCTVTGEPLEGREPLTDRVVKCAVLISMDGTEHQVEGSPLYIY